MLTKRGNPYTYARNVCTANVRIDLNVTLAVLYARYNTHIAPFKLYICMCDVFERDNVRWL